MRYYIEEVLGLLFSNFLDPNIKKEIMALSVMEAYTTYQSYCIFYSKFTKTSLASFQKFVLNRQHWFYSKLII